MLGHARHVSLQAAGHRGTVTVPPPGSAARPLGRGPTRRPFVSGRFLLSLLILGSTCLSRACLLVGRAVDVKKSTAEEKLWVSPRSPSLPVHVLVGAMARSPWGTKPALQGALSQISVPGVWPEHGADLGQPFLGSSRCVHPLATMVLPLCCACFCASPQCQSRPPEQPPNESQGLGSQVGAVTKSPVSHHI